ncbi:hypothetical protein OQA88_13009 [Cercophora sp. LCS_1]
MRVNGLSGEVDDALEDLLDKFYTSNRSDKEFNLDELWLRVIHGWRPDKPVPRVTEVAFPPLEQTRFVVGAFNETAPAVYGQVAFMRPEMAHEMGYIRFDIVDINEGVWIAEQVDFIACYETIYDAQVFAMQELDSNICKQAVLHNKQLVVFKARCYIAGMGPESGASDAQWDVGREAKFAKPTLCAEMMTGLDRAIGKTWRGVADARE